MQKPDEIKLTFDQNPSLAEALQQVAVGESVELEIKATLKSKDTEGVILTVEAAIPDGYEMGEPGDEQEPVAGMGDGMLTAAPMTPTAMLVRRKSMGK
jgi:hypothetical protein